MATFVKINEARQMLKRLRAIAIVTLRHRPTVDDICAPILEILDEAEQSLNLETIETGADIRRVREAMGIKQGILARACGVSRAFLSQVELGQVALSDNLRDRVATALYGRVDSGDN